MKFFVIVFAPNRVFRDADMSKARHVYWAFASGCVCLGPLVAFYWVTASPRQEILFRSRVPGEASGRYRTFQTEFLMGALATGNEEC